MVLRYVEWGYLLVFFIVILTVPFILFTCNLQLLVTEGYTDAFKSEAFLNHSLQNRHIVSYLNHDTETMPPALNDRELVHLADVRFLLDLAGIITYILIILDVILLSFILFMKPEKKKIVQGMMLYAGSLCVVIALLAVLGGFFFSDVFFAFHTLFFEGDSWLFNPGDVLVTLYPLRFFQMSYGVLFALLFVEGITFLSLYFFVRRRVQVRHRQ